jgi:hypothetical protein
VAASLEAWRPTVADVANLVPERTGAVDVNGALVPRASFDADTVPTDVQVAGLIRGVQNEVVPLTGAMPVQLTVIPSGGTIGESVAGHVVALGAASLVESQFYPDMQLGGDNPATVLDRRYRAALAALVKAVNEILAGTDPGDQPRPVGAFPATPQLGLATTPWETW